MITTDEKIEVFRKIINEDIESKVLGDVSEIKEQNSKKIADYKAKRYEDIEKLKNEYDYRLDIKSETIRSKTQKEGQDIVLATNRHMYEEFFKDLREKLKSDYVGEKGEKYVINKLEQVKESIKSDDRIYVFDETYDRDKQLILSIIPNASIEKSDHIKLGGFEVENSEKTYRMNYSVDFILDSEYTNILTKLKKEIGINL